MKTYPKKTKKAYQPMFNSNGTPNLNSSTFSQKSVNPANFMSEEEFSKSKYATMSKSDFEDERMQDAMNSKSF